MNVKLTTKAGHEGDAWRRDFAEARKCRTHVFTVCNGNPHKLRRAPLAQSLIRKCTARGCLQIEFKLNCFAFIGKRYIRHQTPRLIFSRVGANARDYAQKIWIANHRSNRRRSDLEI